MDATVIPNNISEKEGYIIETKDLSNELNVKAWFKVDNKLKVFSNFRLAKSIATRLQYETETNYTIEEYSKLLEKVIII